MQSPIAKMLRHILRKRVWTKYEQIRYVDVKRNIEPADLETHCFHFLEVRELYTVSLLKKGLPIDSRRKKCRISTN